MSITTALHTSQAGLMMDTQKMLNQHRNAQITQIEEYRWAIFLYITIHSFFLSNSQALLVTFFFFFYCLVSNGEMYLKPHAAMGVILFKILPS